MIFPRQRATSNYLPSVSFLQMFVDMITKNDGIFAIQIAWGLILLVARMLATPQMKSGRT
jgi:hypothetical protein